MTIRFFEAFHRTVSGLHIQCPFSEYKRMSRFEVAIGGVKPDYSSKVEQVINKQYGCLALIQIKQEATLDIRVI